MKVNRRSSPQLISHPSGEAHLTACISLHFAPDGSNSQTPFKNSQHTLGNEKSSPFDSEFDALVNETLVKYHAPGLAIAVVKGNDTWAKVSTNFIRIYGYLYPYHRHVF